jgi:hypothetical protein
MATARRAYSENDDFVDAVKERRVELDVGCAELGLALSRGDDVRRTDASWSVSPQVHAGAHEGSLVHARTLPPGVRRGRDAGSRFEASAPQSSSSRRPLPRYSVRQITSLSHPPARREHRAEPKALTERALRRPREELTEAIEAAFEHIPRPLRGTIQGARGVSRASENRVPASRSSKGHESESRAETAKLERLLGIGDPEKLAFLPGVPKRELRSSRARQWRTTPR